MIWFDCNKKGNLYFVNKFKIKFNHLPFIFYQLNKNITKKKKKLPSNLSKCNELSEEH